MNAIILAAALLVAGQNSPATGATYEVCVAESGLKAGDNVYHSDIFEAGDKQSHEAEFTAALRAANLPNTGVFCLQATDRPGMQKYVAFLAHDPGCATCSVRKDVPIHWRPRDPLAELLGGPASRPAPRPSDEAVAQAGVEAEARADAEQQARSAEFRAQNLADAKAAADRRAAVEADYAARLQEAKVAQETYERNLQTGRAADAAYRAAEADFRAAQARAKAAADQYAADKAEYDRKYGPR